MEASKEEKKDIKKTLKKVNPTIDLKNDLELIKSLCRNMNVDVLRRINEANLSIDSITQRLKKVEGRLGL